MPDLRKRSTVPGMHVVLLKRSLLTIVGASKVGCTSVRGYKVMNWQV